MDVTLLFITCIASLQMTHAKLNVTVEPFEQRTILPEGDNLTMMCSVKQSISSCKWIIKSRRVLLDLKPESDINFRGGIKYFGRGLEYGECGITLLNVREEDASIYICRLNVLHQILEEYLSVKVALEATYLHINVTRIDPVNNLYPNNTFEENKRILAECTFEIPQEPFIHDPEIEWYIGNEHIQTDEIDYTGHPILETRYVEKNLTYSDNGKNLMCVLYLSHKKPRYRNYPLFTLIVYFSPKVIKIEQSAFRIGRPGEIIVTTDANPRPTIEWFVDAENITEGSTDPTGKFYAFNLIPRGKHTWEAVLRIDDVGSNDVIKNYTFTASNTAGNIRIGVVIPVCHAPLPNTTDCLPLSDDSASTPICFTDANTCPPFSHDRTTCPTCPSCPTPPAKITTYSSPSLNLATCPTCSADITAWSIAGIVTATLLIILVAFVYNRLIERRRFQHIKLVKASDG